MGDIMKKLKIIILSFVLLFILYSGNVSAQTLKLTIIERSTNEFNCLYELDTNPEKKIRLTKEDKVISPKTDKKGAIIIHYLYAGSSDHLFLDGYMNQGDKTYSAIGFDLKEIKHSNNCPEKMEIEFKDNGMILTSTKQKSSIKKVYCGTGEGSFKDIPAKIPELTSYIIKLIQVLVPVILVIFGSIDLFKGITAGKEDEIKKGQQIFIKRLVVGVIIFLVVIIVKFFISIVADANKSNIADCIDCFISNDCEEM